MKYTKNELLNALKTIEETLLVYETVMSKSSEYKDIDLVEMEAHIEIMLSTRQSIMDILSRAI